MNSNTKTPTSTGMPLDAPRPGPERVGPAGRAAGRPQPVAVAASSRGSRAGRRSRSCASASTKLPGSSTSSMRRADDSGKWCSHCGQTLSFFSSVGGQQRRAAARALGEHPSRDAALLLRKIVVAILSFVPGHRCREYRENTLSEPRVVCYAAPVHFGAWHKISDACTAAPEPPGSCRPAPRARWTTASGRSAMVFYACSEPEETLRRFVAGRGARQIERAVSAGARWIRFAESAQPAGRARPPAQGVRGAVRIAAHQQRGRRAGRAVASTRTASRRDAAASATATPASTSTPASSWSSASRGTSAARSAPR